MMHHNNLTASWIDESDGSFPVLLSSHHKLVSPDSCHPQPLSLFGEPCGDFIDIDRYLIIYGHLRKELLLNKYTFVDVM